MKTAKKFWKPCFTIICISIIFFNVFSVLWSQKDKYLARNYWENFPALEKAFLNSQYVSKHPAGWIPDETAFSYAGGKLVTGTSPVLVVVDAPPLGKYLIGVSTLIFDNPHIVVAIFGILSLFMLYLVANQVLDNKLLALLPLLFYSSEPMFKNQFIFTPLLDLFQLVFLLCYFYFINKAFTQSASRHSGKQSAARIKSSSPRDTSARSKFFPKMTMYFILASLFLGFFISTKFFVSGLTIIAASMILTLFHKKIRQTIILLLTLPISITILLLNYIRVFAFGYSFHRFLGIQKYIFLYHKSQIILPFSVWPLLLFNRWYVWFGNKPFIADSQWAITWPIITIISFITMILYLLKKIPKKLEIEVLMIWSVCYLLFLSSGQTFSRYLIILLPIFYIISIYGLKAIIGSFLKQTKKS
jgi:hypothetical protein